MSVALEIQNCDAPAEIVRIVEIELGERTQPAGAPDSVHVVVACEGTSVAVSVDDAGTSTSRTIDLAGAVPKARARLLALAVVELVSTNASEREATRTTAPRGDTATGPDPGAGVRRDGKAIDNRDDARFRVLAFGGGLAFDAGTGLLGGGGARVIHDGAPIGWIADIEAHHGESDVSRGRVTTDVIDAAAAIALHRARGRLHATAGAGVRGGLARFAGATSDMMVRTDKFWAPWFGVFAIANAEVSATSRVKLHFAIEGGRVVSPVGGLVDQRREIGIDGAWLGVHVGIGTIL